MNAVYFKAAWLEQFDENATAPKPFHNMDGSISEVPMMSNVVEIPYAQTEHYQAALMGYEGFTTGMIIILPKEDGLKQVEEEMTAAATAAAMDRMTPHDVTLEMPRFQFETELKLPAELRNMGLTAPFGPEADFSGMDGQSCASHPQTCLTVSDIVHKAVVKNDEEGTEAAAVTAIMMRNESMREPPPKATLKLDRPFLFMIVDFATGTPIFIGRVGHP